METCLAIDGLKNSYKLNGSKWKFLWIYLAAFSCLTLAEANNTTGPRIVIIGAGPSGIASATKLLEYGFQNVIIVEAEPRIGGRIHTIPFADNVVDLGAQWCHGEKGNVVYELASKLDLLESSEDREHVSIRSNGEVVPETIQKPLLDICIGDPEKEEMELRNYNGSFGSYLTKSYYAALQIPENKDIDKDIAKEFFAFCDKNQNVLDASDTSYDVSASQDLEYWECDGDQGLNWKDKGYKEFLRLLMKSRELDTPFGTLEKRILLDKQITEILWARNDSSVALKCADGEVLVADHVIITVSLGVLKEQQARLFMPHLPEEKQRAIDGLGFGTVNKIFIEFREEFWPANWTGFGMLWRDKDLAEIRGTSRAWLEDLYDFSTVVHKPRLLEAFIFGANARYMETLPDEEVLAGCMYLLKRFLPWNIPEPLSLKTSSWHTNRHFRGSYSFRSMHTEEVGTSAHELAQPLIVDAGVAALNGNESASGAEKPFVPTSCEKPVVQFAGEATSDHHFSTVHGAVESGWREAKRLLDFYGMKDPVATIKN